MCVIKVVTAIFIIIGSLKMCFKTNILLDKKFLLYVLFVKKELSLILAGDLQCSIRQPALKNSTIVLVSVQSTLKIYIGPLQ